MVVDPAGEFVTQRELPRMALVRPTLEDDELVLRAPGMLALHVALDTVEAPTAATVWDDRVAAYDMGDLSARWFSDFLGTEVRLVRFDPEQKRLASRAWTGDIEAENAFQDGFPLLVASTASLAEVNRRLARPARAAVEMARFRPNIVLDGLDAHGEDALDEIVFATPTGRCGCASSSPARAARFPTSTRPRRTRPCGRRRAAGYRADPRWAARSRSG